MNKPGYEDWYTRHVTLDEAINAGRISRAWALQREKQWGKDSSVFLNRVMGEFADTSEEGVIPLSWVRCAIERHEAWCERGRPDTDGMLTLGVDVARGGEDKTVIAHRMGWVIQKLSIYSKLPTTATAGYVKSLCRGRRVHIEMDGGLGAAVYDMLREQEVPLLHPITVSGGTAFRDTSGELSFLNIRAAMWWNMRQLLDPDKGQEIMIPNNDNLIIDLVSPKWIMMKDATIKLEPKEKIIKRLGRSTDYGDAVCLAFWDSGGGGGVVF